MSGTTIHHQEDEDLDLYIADASPTTLAVNQNYDSIILNKHQASRLAIELNDWIESQEQK